MNQTEFENLSNFVWFISEPLLKWKTSLYEISRSNNNHKLFDDAYQLTEPLEFDEKLTFHSVTFCIYHFSFLLLFSLETWKVSGTISAVSFSTLERGAQIYEFLCMQAKCLMCHLVLRKLHRFPISANKRKVLDQITEKLHCSFSRSAMGSNFVLHKRILALESSVSGSFFSFSTKQISYSHIWPYFLSS